MKRSVALLLTATLTLSVLTSCGGNNTAATNTSTNTTAGSEAKSETKSEQSGSGFNQTGLPIVNEPVTYRIAGVKEAVWPDDLSTFKVIQKYEKDTNVKFQYQLYTSEAWGSQKQLIAASKDLPDAFGVGNPLSQQDIMDFSTQGIIIPLKELSQKYAPRFTEIMTEYPAYYKSFLSVDNEFYAYPTHYDIDFGNRGGILHLNKAWIQELRPDYKIVKGETLEYIDENISLDEYYKLLTDMRDKYPNAIPQTCDSPNFENIYSAYGVFNTSSRVYVDNGVVKDTITGDNWKEATKFIGNMYNDKLIDQEIFTQNWDVFRAKLMEETPIVGASLMWSGLIAVPDFTDMSDPRYANFIPVKPLVGPDGTQQWGRGADGVAIQGSFAITKSAKNPEILVRYQDYLYDEVISLESSYGLLGVGLIDNGDNTYNQIFNAEPVLENTTLNTMFITTKEMNSRVKFAPATQMPQEAADLVVKPFQKPEMTYPSFMFGEADSKKIAQLRTDLNKFIETKQADYIVNGGIDNDWESFKAELDKIGLKEYIQIMQSNYDRYMSMK